MPIGQKKIDYNTRTILKDKSLHNEKGVNSVEDVTFANIDELNREAPKCIKQILGDLQKERIAIQ